MLRNMCVVMVVALVCVSMTVAPAQADSGTWGGNFSGNWWDAANWSGSTIADGADNTATFYHNINGTRTITVDAGGRTIGQLVMNDSHSGSAYSWAFAGGTLTLDRTDGEVPSIWLKPGPTPPYDVGSTHTMGCILAGNKGLWVSGLGGITFTVAPTYTGVTTIQGGTLRMYEVELSTTSAAFVNRGGNLSAFWNNSGYNNNLIDDAIPVTLGGGTLSVWCSKGSGSGTSYETIGSAGAPVTLDYGHCTIAAGGKRATGDMTIANLVRDAGSTAYFSRSDTIYNGDGLIHLTGQAAGFMGGWAVARRADLGVNGDYDFAWYGGSGVEPMLTNVTRQAQVQGSVSTDHVLVAVAQTALSADTSIKSLVVTGAYNNDLGGYELDIASGGLLSTADYTISNGTLTSSGGELFLINYGGTMTVDADILGSGLTTSTVGSMTLSGNNTFGDIYVNTGTLSLTNANTFGSEVQVAPGAVLSLGHADALGANVELSLLFDGEEYGSVEMLDSMTIATLSLGGIEQADGTYGATGSGAAFISDDYFSGTEVLTVYQPPVAEPAGLSLLGLALLGLRRRRN
jgi:fibronectin-binding autotransporter adhesin